MRRLVLTALIGVCTALIATSSAASADIGDERALAERYGPVVRVVEQVEECGPGEPYVPMDVDRLFGEPTVALRGPWGGGDLVMIGPEATDLDGRFEYHLDYPGEALDAGCDYERWSRRVMQGAEPAVYAHVAAQPDRPGKLALQYWFLYAFNDFNNTHEGDWEMIQLVFDAGSAREALQRNPVEVGYSSHEGAERAHWGDSKLELVDRTHPVVYPAAGSHANKYTATLYLGASAAAGVGCDNTAGPHRELRPVVHTIPSDPAAAVAAYPWLAYEGRWGELQRGIFNGPTGPSYKDRWTRPIDYTDHWRDVSYAVPNGGLLGTRTTDLFCTAVGRGSHALIVFLRNPVPTAIALAVVIGLLAYAVARATWTPAAPLHVARRRAGGQILAASARVSAARPLLFLGLGIVFVPFAVGITVLEWLLVSGLGLIGSVTGDIAGVFAYLSLVVGTTVALLGLGLVQSAAACALVELDAGRPIGPLEAYRLSLRRIRPLLGAVAIFVVAWIALSTTVFLLPLAVWFAVRWSLLAPVVALEGLTPVAALRRSAELVHGRWLRVGALVGLSAALAFAAGPVLGVLLIFVLSESSLAVVNIVAGVVYTLALPFVALVTSYVYFDARTRHELEPRDASRELPAEIAIERA